MKNRFGSGASSEQPKAAPLQKPFLVFENLATVPRRRLFTFLGVEWVATPYAWLGPVLFSALGLLVAEGVDPTVPPAGRMVRGVGYGLFLYLCNSAHSFGHILAGRMAGVPMNANLLTATRDVNVYEGERRSVPEHVRVARSLGGPAFNLILGLLAVLVASGMRNEWIRACAYLSLGVGFWTLAPVPTLDGWILWKAVVRRFRR